MNDVPSSDHADDEAEQEDLLLSQQPTVDAASLQTQRHVRKTVLKELAEEISFWRLFLDEPVGRRLLWRIIAVDLHTFEDRFAASPTGVPDPNATWFQAGQQSYGNRLYRTFLRIDPIKVKLMHEENDPMFPKQRAPRRKPADG